MGDFLTAGFCSLVKRGSYRLMNFLIGNGPAPAYVAKINRRQLDIFIPLWL